MKYNELIHLKPLMNLTNGSSIIAIGLIDGPISINHPDLNKENISQIPGTLSGTCTTSDSIACSHGTFIAGILKAKRDSNAPAICPDCSLIVRPIFSEQTKNKESIPSTTLIELATAIIDCINAGARLINLSLALATPSCNGERELEDVLSFAAERGVLIVAAAGNQGTVGSTAITRHPWVIPVIASNNYGNPMQLSNLGNSIGRRGFRAPGENITSLGCNNNYITSSGTSIATPFVTGIMALLWSEFPYLSGSVIKQAVSIVNNRSSIIPPLINAMTAFQYLNSNYTKKVIV
jgi:subtilisin family serine protease